jgi:uncharacterized membrane protein YobD (UPF0266 family)
MVGKTAAKSTASTIVVLFCILILDNLLSRSIRHSKVFTKFDGVFKNHIYVQVQNIKKMKIMNDWLSTLKCLLAIFATKKFNAVVI